MQTEFMCVCAHARICIDAQHCNAPNQALKWIMHTYTAIMAIITIDFHATHDEHTTYAAVYAKRSSAARFFRMRWQLAGHRDQPGGRMHPHR